MMPRLPIYPFLVLMVFFGCIEPFNPDLPSTIDNSELVVEGFVTDYESIQSVRLRRMQAVGDSTPPLPESGAVIRLRDNLGNEYSYQESASGLYTLDSNTFQAENGNSYQISITRSNGERFSSDFQELKSSLPIDTAWWRVESETIIMNELPLTREFVKIFSFLDESEKVRFSYNGRYEFLAPLQGSISCFANPPDSLIPSDLVCYLPDESDNPLNILLGGSVTDPQNTERNIVTILNDRRFARAFSILLEKFTLTDSYFDFLDQIRRQTENDGLFAPPPTEIFGNITSDDDPSIIARGFFTTLSKAERRIFIDDIFFNNPADPFCQPATLSNGVVVPPQLFCCDCRLAEGAIAEQPPYWGD